MLLTKEEKKAFAAMNEADKIKFRAEKEKIVTQATHKFVLLLQLTIEQQDVLENIGFVVGKIKTTAKPYKLQALNFLNKLYGGNPLDMTSIDLITRLSKRVDQAIEDEYELAVKEEAEEMAKKAQS